MEEEYHLIVVETEQRADAFFGLSDHLVELGGSV
jgi:hypothetical protein